MRGRRLATETRALRARPDVLWRGRAQACRACGSAVVRSLEYTERRGSAALPLLRLRSALVESRFRATFPAARVTVEPAVATAPEEDVRHLRDLLVATDICVR